MNKTKQALLVAGGVVSIGAAGLGLSATTSALSDTSSSTDPMSSLIDKLVSKFNLKKSDVQAVFDEAREATDKDMKTERLTALKKALSNGKITQAQYDHIVAAWEKIDALHDKDKTDANREKIHKKMEALRKWMEAQNITMSDLGLPVRGPRGDRGEHMDS